MQGCLRCALCNMLIPHVSWLICKKQRFRKVLQKHFSIVILLKLLLQNLSVTNCFLFHLVVLKARNMNVLGLEKFRMNTIQTEDENFVFSRVERTLVGADENEEHLGGLRERGRNRRIQKIL